MTWPAVMRALAVAIAVAAAIDPALRVTRLAPLPIALRSSTGALVPPGAPPGTPADDSRTRLEAEMPGALAINTAAAPRALIVAGSTIDPASVPAEGPVSFVSPAVPPGPSVEVTAVHSPRAVLPGWAAVVEAEVEARGVTPGSASVVVLESHGVEVDRVKQVWARSEGRATVRLSFAPPSVGVFVLAVRALSDDGASALSTGAVPARVLAEQRRLRILAFDPRPSWGSVYTRRALEDDPDFDVVARVRASRGLDVRTGAAPVTLSTAAVDPFDLVLVGAPEELTNAELAVLEAFADRRGGVVVLMPDRKPSGAYGRLVGAGAFEETLLDKPVRLTAADGTALRGSEFAYATTPPAGAEPVVSMMRGSASRAPIVTVPVGAGRVIFSGVLDAWRYRAEEDDAFAAFWRSLLGSAAARAPRRLEVSLEPGVATAGQRVRLRAEVRATEHVTAGEVVNVPALTATVVDERGAQRPVRMWPTAQAGRFEGWFDASRAGRYDVRVAAGAVSADLPFVVTAFTPDHPVAKPGQASAALAGATGGIETTIADLQSLVAHLRGLTRDNATATWHPMRSAWWAVAFAGLLCVEWAARRRRGLR